RAGADATLACPRVANLPQSADRAVSGPGRASFRDDAVDLGQAGDALLDLAQCRLAQIPYACRARHVGYLQRIPALQDHALDFLEHGHHLVDTHATLVAIIARRAAHGFIQREAFIDVGLAEANL